MKINEIFYSIQGEGNWTGLPNIFIRTSGCNLRCSYCDTKYAYDSFKEIKIIKIIDEIRKYNCKKVCITGGEPLLQKNMIKLVDELIKNNYNVSIETNGSIEIKPIANKKLVMISLDIKCPSSDMAERMLYQNLLYLKKKDQLKFIIGDIKDYRFAKEIIINNKIICSIFFQPVAGTDPRKLANWIIKDNLNVKLGLQIQKILWQNRRGK
jgi:7-carboxy-7-deazaguanine synthase